MSIRQAVEELKSASGPADVAGIRVRQMIKSVEKARKKLVKLRETHLTKEPVSKIERDLELLWHEADDLPLWQLEPLMRNWLGSRRE